jgi:hypothetical protein
MLNFYDPNIMNITIRQKIYCLYLYSIREFFPRKKNYLYPQYPSVSDPFSSLVARTPRACLIWANFVRPNPPKPGRAGSQAAGSHFPLSLSWLWPHAPPPHFSTVKPWPALAGSCSNPVTSLTLSLGGGDQWRSSPEPMRATTVVARGRAPLRPRVAVVSGGGDRGELP